MPQVPDGRYLVGVYVFFCVCMSVRMGVPVSSLCMGMCW